MGHIYCYICTLCFKPICRENFTRTFMMYSHHSPPTNSLPTMCFSCLAICSRLLYVCQPSHVVIQALFAPLSLEHFALSFSLRLSLSHMLSAKPMCSCVWAGCWPLQAETSTLTSKSLEQTPRRGKAYNHSTAIPGGSQRDIHKSWTIFAVMLDWAAPTIQENEGGGGTTLPLVQSENETGQIWW